MKTRIKWILGSGVLFFALLQCFRPRFDNPPVLPGQDLLATNSPPADIVRLLKDACYDCHSNETRWPWYSRIVPVSWWLVEHVNDGRQNLNFSEWHHEDSQRTARKWRRVSNQVDSGEMPLASYTWGHPAARFSADQRTRLVQWAQQEAERLKVPATTGQ